MNLIIILDWIDVPWSFLQNIGGLLMEADSAHILHISSLNIIRFSLFVCNLNID